MTICPFRPLLALAACALVAGCGGDDKASDSDQIGAVIAQLGDAARDGDGKRICEDLFTENLAISVAKASGSACPDEVRANIFAADAEFDVGPITVKGTNANVTVTDQRQRSSALLLQRESGSWRIARIG